MPSRITKAGTGLEGDPQKREPVLQCDNSGIANLQSQMSGTNNKANAGTSAALAAAGLVQATRPGESLITGGVGYWQGQSALAFGLSHRFSGDLSAWTVKASGAVSASGNGVGGNASVGYSF